MMNRNGASSKQLMAAGPYKIGEPIWDGVSVDEIQLVCDGHGPMGYYDMIYVYLADGRVRAMPAHDTDCWEYMMGKNDA